MEICVMVGNKFYNEDSEIVRVEGAKLNESGEMIFTIQDQATTTLKAMYTHGWMIKDVTQFASLDHRLLFFLER